MSYIRRQELTAGERRLELTAGTTALLVVDIQERLCAAMPQAVVEAQTRNVGHLLTLAARLDVPVIVTEQYPQGLGPTVAPLRALFTGQPFAPFPKTSFSAMRDAPTAEAVRATGRTSIVVVGLETHVCVYQTVRDLCAAGFTVHVPADAVASRTKENFNVGLQLLSLAGGVPTSTEVVLFDWLKVGSGEIFKEVSRRLR